ncbi:SseB family protein [Legionella israelensis]|nr:SseB family protein [Legionella israelensis]QBS11128.1 SseB family protein [Legionella israelensis]
MRALEESIKKAFASTGEAKDINKAYLEFIKANFIIPVEKNTESEPRVLFLQEKEQTYLPVFSDISYFHPWAEEIAEQIELLNLSGVDLLKGIGEQVTVCLNIGSEIYKEFNPAEIARMKNMVLKIFSPKII